jgi:Zn-dependent protease
LKFSLFNVSIKIEYSIFLVIALSLILENYNIIFVLLFSCFHEIGHIATLYFFKGKADVITISYYGIGLKHSSKLNYLQEIIFLISGVAINYAFALLNIKREINLAIALLNSLPIYPLDVGRALKLILNNIFSLNISDKIYKAVSAITIFLFIIIALYLKNLNLILISIYIIFYCVNNTFD